MTYKHSASSKIVCTHANNLQNERTQCYIGRAIPFFENVAFECDRFSDGRDCRDKRIDANFDDVDSVFKEGAHTCKRLCVCLCALQWLCYAQYHSQVVSNFAIHICVNT
jgi:hypothetical protein